MPAKATKSGLISKYGDRLRKAVKDHAGDEINYGFQRLPGGITNGIAQLTECGFKQVEAGKQNAGEYYFRAAGVVLEPEEVEGKNGPERVKGRTTSIIRMVCDTKDRNGNVTQTLDDNVAWILNEMRKLGADIDEDSADLMEEVAAALQEAKPYFRFRTTESPATPQFPNPRVWENWDGTKGLEDYEPEEADDVDDRTEEPAAKSPPKTQSGPTRRPTAKQPDPEPEPAPEYDDASDIDSLLARANDDDADAQEKLLDLAKAQGHDEADLQRIDTWDGVADLLRGGGEDGESGGEGGPAVGDTVKYKVVTYDPRTKKEVASRRPIQCEVMTVSDDGETVTLKNLVTNKTVVDKNGKAAKVKVSDLEE